MNQAVATVQQDNTALSIENMADQVNQIQKLMNKVMKSDVHFGMIPGTGKNALFKAGAEKIGLMFGCRPSFEINRTDLPNAHREYEVTCQVVNRYGEPIGQGVGACTTMEKKYRYRAENTGMGVPSEYWDSRDRSLLGGSDFVPRKVSGSWMIFQQVEYDNPADYYNTVLKMAKKRAYVDAILTCTAASDFFDQEEVIDTPELYDEDGSNGEPQAKEQGTAPRQPRAKSAPKGGLQDGQLRIVTRKLEAAGIEAKALLAQFKVKKLEDVPAANINDVLDWIKSQQEEGAES